MDRAAVGAELDTAVGDVISIALNSEGTVNTFIIYLLRHSVTGEAYIFFILLY
jgi:hypothetical protein